MSEFLRSFERPWYRPNRTNTLLLTGSQRFVVVRPSLWEEDDLLRESPLNASAASSRLIFSQAVPVAGSQASGDRFHAGIQSLAETIVRAIGTSTSGLRAELQPIAYLS
jgi:hypothetical protein